MRSFLNIGVVVVLAFFSNYILGVDSQVTTTAHVVTNCDGTQFVRTGPGELKALTVAKNLPGCIWSNNDTTPDTKDTRIITSDVTNCSGLRIIAYSDGTMKSERTVENAPGCLRTIKGNSGTTVNVSNGPLLDLASTDIGNYRKKLLEDKGIRFADAVRSARIRREATKKSSTEAILMRNDAVVVEGKETGWVKVQWAELVVTDKRENTVEADTTGKAEGYTASRLLRKPNISDLVKIEQADHAYWSDIAYTKVEKYVNIRTNPNYTAPIVTTLGNNYPLYIVSTVDNWSFVRTDDGVVQGYIRSDYLRIVKSQRVDRTLGIR